jgi:hypothetical protein
MKHTAIHLRVSAKAQRFDSQEPDLKRWVEINGKTCRTCPDVSEHWTAEGFPSAPEGKRNGMVCQGSRMDTYCSSR